MVGRMRCSVYESERSATRVLGVHSARSMSLSMSTMYLPSVDVLTSTRALDLSPPAEPPPTDPAPAMALATSPMYEPGSCSKPSSSRSARTLAFSSVRCGTGRAGRAHGGAAGKGKGTEGERQRARR